MKPAASHANAKPSLVDGAEEALRNWLAPGRHRPGDRLPPEHDLASMLGVSRGTLRTALQRLEDTGEIVRRQGSGTFVGVVSAQKAFQEGLERLVPYSSLARRQGVKLTVRDMRIEHVALDAEMARRFELDPGVVALRVSRVVVIDGEPAALMVDTIRPDMPLPTEARLRRALDGGDMVLDVALRQSVPIAYSDTQIRSRLIHPRDRIAKALGLRRTTAVLQLDESFHVTSGGVAYHSLDLFAPRGLDLHVIRWLEAQQPEQVSGADNGGRAAGRTRRSRRT